MKKITVKNIIISIVLLVGLTLTATGCEKKVKRIELDKTELTVETGETFSLSANVFPEDAGDKSVKWRVLERIEFPDGKDIYEPSSNVRTLTDEATESMEFTALARGNVIVRATASNLSVDCKVTVIESDKDRINSERVAEERKVEQEKIASETVSLKTLLADAQKYDGQFVRIADKLVVVRNDLEDRYLSTFLSTNPESAGKDFGLFVYYNKMPDATTWAQFSTNDHPIIRAEGTFHLYSNMNNTGYLTASKITKER